MDLEKLKNLFSKEQSDKEQSDSVRLELIKEYFPPASSLPSRVFGAFLFFLPDFLKSFNKIIALAVMIFILLSGKGYLTFSQKACDSPNISLIYKELEVSKKEVLKNSSQYIDMAQEKIRFP